MSDGNKNRGSVFQRAKLSLLRLLSRNPVQETIALLPESAPQRVRSSFLSRLFGRNQQQGAMPMSPEDVGVESSMTPDTTTSAAEEETEEAGVEPTTTSAAEEETEEAEAEPTMASAAEEKTEEAEAEPTMASAAEARCKDANRTLELLHQRLDECEKKLVSAIQREFDNYRQSISSTLPGEVAQESCDTDNPDEIEQKSCDTDLDNVINTLEKKFDAHKVEKIEASAQLKLCVILYKRVTKNYRKLQPALSSYVHDANKSAITRVVTIYNRLIGRLSDLDDALDEAQWMALNETPLAESDTPYATPSAEVASQHGLFPSPIATPTEKDVASLDEVCTPTP
jgi:hypothetical protein